VTVPGPWRIVGQHRHLERERNVLTWTNDEKRAKSRAITSQNNVIADLVVRCPPQLRPQEHASRGAHTVRLQRPRTHKVRLLHLHTARVKRPTPVVKERLMIPTLLAQPLVPTWDQPVLYIYINAFRQTPETRTQTESLQVEEGRIKVKKREAPESPIDATQHTPPRNFYPSAQSVQLPPLHSASTLQLLLVFDTLVSDILVSTKSTSLHPAAGPPPCVREGVLVCAKVPVLSARRSVFECAKACLSSLECARVLEAVLECARTHPTARQGKRARCYAAQRTLRCASAWF
jgi:hypothetical protein